MPPWSTWTQLLLGFASRFVVPTKLGVSQNLGGPRITEKWFFLLGKIEDYLDHPIFGDTFVRHDCHDVFWIVVACEWLLVSPGLQQDIHLKYTLTRVILYTAVAIHQEHQHFSLTVPVVQAVAFLFSTFVSTWKLQSQRPSRCLCCSSSVQRCSAYKLEAWSLLYDVCQAWSRKRKWIAACVKTSGWPLVGNEGTNPHNNV